MAFSSPEMKVLEGADMQKLIEERITGETQVSRVQRFLMRRR